MIRIASRRTVGVAALVCAGFGAGGVVAVQAAASGRPATAVSPHRGIANAIAPMAAATNASCGQTITASLTLNGDLSCASGNGLTVSGTSVVLNLNGHQIAGPRTSATFGVRLTGATETVTNGVVANFGQGVVVAGSGDTVSSVRSSDNTDNGIEDLGQSTKLTNDVAWENTNVGINSFSTGGTATYSGDHELNNSGIGLKVDDGSGSVTVTSNVANGNTSYGMFDTGHHTTFKANTTNYNGQDGIWIAEFFTIDGGGNSAKGNDYGSSTTPEECNGVVCS